MGSIRTEQFLTKKRVQHDDEVPLSARNVAGVLKWQIDGKKIHFHGACSYFSAN